MTVIEQIVTVTNGFTGAPGYTNMFFSTAVSTTADRMTAVRDFWEAIAGQFPSAWTYAISNEVNQLNDDDGSLVGTTSAFVALQGTFGAAGNYAAAAGACASWSTAAIHGTHRLRGRTFLVPLSGNAYEGNGTLNSTALASLQGAASALVASGTGFGVWGRPRAAKVVGGVTVPALAGMFAPATGAAVRDKVAILRSRRD